MPEIVETTCGRVAGSIEGGVTVFKGVPYATPPTGDLRWRPPRSPQSWSGVRDATRFSERCSQNADLGIFSRPGGSEDCLHLNVYAPTEAIGSNSTRLPVLVWLHGGSFWVGAASDYDGSRLAARGPAVVVTVNSRLGLLGFFAHPTLAAEGEVGNFGLMDQAMALRWVRENAAAFGGDPGNVTIAGESSGGASVFSHVLSPRSKGLFHHAIAMSGSAVVLRQPAFGAPKSLATAEDLGTAFAETTGCAGDPSRLLRGLPIATILERQRPFLHNQLMVDGTTVPDHPGGMFADGDLNDVTLVNGVTRDEGTFFAAMMEAARGAPMDAAGYRDAMAAYYGPDLGEEVMREYPIGDHPSPSNAYAAAVTSSLFAATAEAVNRRIAARARLHVYEFADGTAPSYVGQTSFPLGASHTFELPYLFPGFNGAGVHEIMMDEGHRHLSDEMTALWTGLHRAGDEGWPWPRYDPARENVMTFEGPSSSMREGEYRRRHKCDFWDGTGLY